MYLTKKAGRLIIIYSLAAVLTMGGFLALERERCEVLERADSLSCDQAFAELNDNLGALDTSLKKALCAASPSMVSAICAEGYAHCAAASQAIASLPYGSIELEHTASFITRAGDYLRCLSRAGAGGGELGDEQRKILSSLSECASQVSGTMSELTARLLAGDVSAAELQRAEDTVAGAEERVGGAGLLESFRDMETDLPELPTLIYDGPFSDHIKKAQPEMLKGLEDVGQDAAAKAAADFLGCRKEELDFIALREGDMPVYVFTRQHLNEVESVEVTKKGGLVAFFGTAREPGEGSVSTDAALDTALRFLEKHGFSDMTSTGFVSEGGELTASFAFTQNGVLCYPDLVKVVVATDTGRVCGMEAEGYIMSHRIRELASPAFDTDGAVSRLSPMLKNVSHRPALIPTEGKNEVLCEEYLCEGPGGRRVLVYLNAASAAEEKILLLLESDSGRFTL